MMVTLKGLGKIFVVIFLIIGLIMTGYGAMNGLNTESNTSFFLTGITCLGICVVLALASRGN